MQLDAYSLPNPDRWLRTAVYHAVKHAQARGLSKTDAADILDELAADLRQRE